MIQTRDFLKMRSRFYHWAATHHEVDDEVLNFVSGLLADLAAELDERRQELLHLLHRADVAARVLR